MSEVIDIFINTLKDLWFESGLYAMDWRSIVMILISFVFMYLAIVKGFEPLLLLPIAFGMFLTNLPHAGMYHPELFNAETFSVGAVLKEGGLLDMLYLGVKLQIYPPLIFLGIGCMTDFGPLISNPKAFVIGSSTRWYFLYIRRSCSFRIQCCSIRCYFNHWWR